MALTVWVTGSDILQHVGNTSPSSADTYWAAQCAEAVSSGINRYLGVAADPLPEGALEEIAPAAIVAGTEAYKRREAPWGMTGYLDLQGAALRVSRDWLDSIRPQLQRWASPVERFA